MTNPKDRAVQDRALPIAYHEMGHYVVAKALGFSVTDVSITITFPNGHLGTSGIEPATTLSTKDQIAAYIENRIIALYAGSLAETLDHSGKVDKEKALRLLGAKPAQKHMEATATQDHAKARELVHLLRSVTHAHIEDRKEIQEQLNEIDRRVWNKAAEMVESDSGLIMGLGRNLAARVKKSGVRAEITQAEIDALEAVKERFSN